MAGTAKPLNIIVNLDLQCPEIKELMDKGHNVHFMGDQLNEADLIIGPNCWRMHKGLLKHLDIAIKGARQLKYENQTAQQQEAKPSRKAPVRRKPRATSKVSAATTSGDTTCPNGESSQPADHSRDSGLK